MNRSERMGAVIRRVEYIRTYLGLNKSRFSTEIGLKPQTYNNFIGTQASKPSAELLQGIVERFGVNSNWLLGVDGEPIFCGGPSVLLAYGERNAAALERSGLPGVTVRLHGIR